MLAIKYSNRKFLKSIAMITAFVIIAVSAFSVSAFATDAIVEDPIEGGEIPLDVPITIIDFPLYDMVSQANNVHAYWEQHGYPEDIGGVFFSQVHQMMGVSVVNLTPEREEELRYLMGEEILIVSSTFSYNELSQAKNQILPLMIDNPESLIYGMGVGWTITDDGQVRGFGESGYESRLIVSVDEDVFVYFSERFSEQFGDMVVVEISEPFTTLARPLPLDTDIDFEEIPLDIDGALLTTDDALDIQAVSSPANRTFPVVLAILFIIAIVLHLKRKGVFSKKHVD